MNEDHKIVPVIYDDDVSILRILTPKCERWVRYRR